MPTGWMPVVSGSGTLTQDTATKNSGVSALKLAKTAALDAAFCRQRLYARAGERLQVAWALRGDGVATAVLRLWNAHTGRYVRPTELEGEAIVAEAPFPAVDDVA